MIFVTKTIDLHLPDGRTDSPFYPPLPPTDSGWLLCESSLLLLLLLLQLMLFLLLLEDDDDDDRNKNNLSHAVGICVRAATSAP